MRTLLAAILMLMTASLTAEEASRFLMIGIGARAIGMGGAYTAVGDDLASMGWNPAGLSLIKKRSAAFMHAELAAGTRFDHVAYAQPTKYGTIGVGVAFLSQGSIEGRDASGRLTGGFSASDSVMNLSYARAISKFLRLGGNLKIIRSNIADETGQTFAFDLGSQYGLGVVGPGKATVGAAIQNLGPEMKLSGQSNPLPLTLATGIGYRLPVGLTLALDYKYRPHAASNAVSIGTEYAVMPSLNLRTGYSSSHSGISGSSRVDDLTGFSAGFGIRVLGLGLDYSVTPFGNLGNAHRVSVGAEF